MRLTQLKRDMVENATYIKLAKNKAHMGPISAEKVAQAKAKALSAAANKVRVTAGFTVKVNTDDNESSIKTNSQNESYLLFDLGDDSPRDTIEYAVLLMQAWDNTFRGEGTPDYVDMLTKALEARATAYRKLGINPASGIKPNLSADQRLVYNAIVGPTGFDYYEYHLAFKLAGQKKFTRSKTFRSLKPMNLDTWLRKMSSEVETLKSRISITPRQMN